jgi:predicted transcriptional regulator
MIKHPTSIRLTPEVKLILERLAEKLGISQTAVIHMALRYYAKQHGVTAARPEEERE